MAHLLVTVEGWGGGGLSLAGAGPSIIFVATNMSFVVAKSMLVAK